MHRDREPTTKTTMDKIISEQQYKQWVKQSITAYQEMTEFYSKDQEISQLISQSVMRIATQSGSVEDQENIWTARCMVGSSVIEWCKGILDPDKDRDKLKDFLSDLKDNWVPPV